MLTSSLDDDRSKSLTMAQACMAAAVMEFAGAVAVGARTAVRFPFILLFPTCI